MSRASDEVGSLLQLGRAHDAAARAAELLVSNPDDIFLHLNAALAWSKIGARDPALRSIDTAIALDAGESESYRVGSIVLGRLGVKKRSYELAERSVALRPDSAACHRQRAHAGASLKGRSVLRDAERSAREAIALAPNSAESHNSLGAVHMARARHRKAIDAFRMALELSPNEPVYHQNIAKSLAATGRKREASEHLLAAGRADPTSDEPIKALRQLSKVGVPAIAAVAVIQVVRLAVSANDTPGPSPTSFTLPSLPAGITFPVPAGPFSTAVTSPPTIPPPNPTTSAAIVRSSAGVATESPGGLSGGATFVIVLLIAALAFVVIRSIVRNARHNTLHPDAKRVLQIDKDLRRRQKRGRRQG